MIDDEYYTALGEARSDRERIDNADPDDRLAMLVWAISDLAATVEVIGKEHIRQLVDINHGLAEINYTLVRIENA